MRALVCSRDERTREWVRDSLGPAWEVEEARDGSDILRAAARERADLVVLDELSAPYGVFGTSLELKQTAAPPGVLILLHRREDAWLARWSRADRWLVRPVDPFELASAVAEIAAAPRRPAPEGEAITVPAEETSGELAG